MSKKNSLKQRFDFFLRSVRNFWKQYIFFVSKFVFGKALPPQLVLALVLSSVSEYQYKNENIKIARSLVSHKGERRVVPPKLVRLDLLIVFLKFKKAQKVVPEEIQSPL